MDELCSKACHILSMAFDEKIMQAHRKAVAAQANSYAPYSKLHVTCVLGTKNGDVLGVNVENASYGGTICAERSAIVSAISQFGEANSFEFIVIISDSPQGPIPPCGLCLQVLREFVDDEFPVYLGDLKTISVKKRFADFLPLSFGSEMLAD